MKFPVSLYNADTDAFVRTNSAVYPIVITTQEELDALPAGWFESPVAAAEWPLLTAEAQGEYLDSLAQDKYFEERDSLAADRTAETAMRLLEVLTPASSDLVIAAKVLAHVESTPALDDDAELERMIAEEAALRGKRKK